MIFLSKQKNRFSLVFLKNPLDNVLKNFFISFGKILKNLINQ
ncbi:hypothetical protein RIEPE_0454 [Candidatus Riesia pediculicola USDA]|uniref:Uncharacterized protein n=1 Tax=Riesia pediculicola (strain USDA) TaxID=515618 RepID=D4G8N9_RIEPU|nr:hypothetical protein RIEPE_0454 [Candidatus Riesia pediculicola USDA]